VEFHFDGTNHDKETKDLQVSKETSEKFDIEGGEDIDKSYHA